MAVYAHSPISLAEAEEYCGLSASGGDAFRESMVNAAIDAMESYCRRYLCARSADVTEVHDGTGTEWIFTRQPIYQVTSIKDDLNQDWASATAFDSNGYTVWGEARMAIRLHPNVNATGNAPLSTQRGRQNVQVIYTPGIWSGQGTTGLSACPEDIKLAQKMIVKAALEDSSHSSVGKGTLRREQISRGDESVTIVKGVLIPAEARSILDQYRVTRVVA